MARSHRPPAIVSITVLAGDTAAPSVTITAPASGATVSGNVTVSANASDNTGVLGVQFLLDGAPLGTEDTTAPYSVTWSSTGVADGAHQLSARARDAAGNQTTATAVAVAVLNTVTPPDPAGLVAAYSFNEASGSVVTDRSGKGHTGTISGAAWTTQGKYGSALTFDGINDWVTVADAADLDLTTGMTLEAWVRPSSLGSWRTVLLKQSPGGLVYSLYASNDSSLAESDVNIGVDVGDGGAVDARAQYVVAHGGHLRRHDAAAVRERCRGGKPPLVGCDGDVDRRLAHRREQRVERILRGRIDEIRIYNRALTPVEIASDMVTPINP